LGDPEIFVEANPIVSPVHIIPEWYFLLFYAILRAIPNKRIGVLGLLRSILIFFMFPARRSIYSKRRKLNSRLVSGVLFMGILLSWLGQCSVESPFVIIRLILSGCFFIIVFCLWFINFMRNVLFTPIKVSY
jgi:quinol-cytochrome oxidoreductase complex cytochrome b subunit